MYLWLKAIHVIFMVTWFAGLFYLPRLFIYHAMDESWFMLKLVFIAALFGYHYWCYRIMLEFREGRNQRSHVWYRWFNEAPAVALIVIVIMVVVKPF